MAKNNQVKLPFIVLALSILAIFAVLTAREIIQFQNKKAEMESFDLSEIELEKADKEKPKPKSIKKVKKDLKIVLENPDLDKPKVYDGQWCSFKYPGNWTVDEEQADNLLIKTSAGQFISFQFFNEVKKKIFDDELIQMTEQVKHNSHEQIDKWGKYGGFGVLIQGTLIKDVEAIVFYSSKNDQSFLLRYISFKSTKLFYDKGLNLIKESFNFKAESKTE